MSTSNNSETSRNFSNGLQNGFHYTMQAEAARILDTLLSDASLKIPDAVKALRPNLEYDGEETQPFYPAPYKAAETQAAVLGIVGLFAATISKERYGLDEEINIDIDQAMLNGLGALFQRTDGDWLSGNKQMLSGVQRWDHGKTRELYRQLATNIYKTKDGKWYSLHGNMDPTPVLNMLGVPQHDEKNRNWPEILKMYMDIVAELDSKTLDDWSNNVYRTPGTICYEEEEFLETQHGHSVKDEPLYNLNKQAFSTQPAVPWPESPLDDKRPLSGLKVLELARAIAAPTIGRVLSSLGATVIRVSSAANTELPITLVDGCLGKISIDINLKTFGGRKILLNLIKDSDVFIDGYRPSVLEHLGFGRDAVLGLVESRSKGIVYCQENCYGWKGPWVHRPGWAQISDTLTGIGLNVGRFNGFEEAHIFPGPNADYLTGHAGAASVLHALYLRSHNGGSYNVQCSLTISNLHMIKAGRYTAEQQEAMKKRNFELVGHMRHYDEIVSHGVNRHCVRGFIADRPFNKAIKGQFYEPIDGTPWGWGKLEVVSLALRLSKSRTDFPLGASPPGYHLPQWTAKRNPDFDPLPVYTAGKS